MDPHKVLDDARKNCGFMANPQAKTFVPRNTTNFKTPSSVPIKTTLALYG